MKRILVCGGRDYSNKFVLTKVLNACKKAHGSLVIIHGDARGADTLAKNWAEENDVLHEPFPADWEKYNKAAGAIRNQQMLDEGKPDFVIAFAGGSGTADMKLKARKASVPVLTITDPK